jgi:SAM-dependent methyltransferase
VTNPASYRRILTEQQYGTTDNLAARQAIYRWADSSVDARRWALDRIPWRGGERVVDLGCGNGRYLPLARERGASSVVGCDLSAGMLAGIDRAANGGFLVQADAQSLPLATGAIDVALAMHMLYHVARVAVAAREMRRVVRPDGTLLAMTNGREHQAELQALASDAMSAVAGSHVERPSLIAGFTFENGEAQLAAAFSRVEAHELRGGIAVPDVAPLVAYIDSQRVPLAWLLPDVEMWPAVLDEVTAMAAEVIARDGVFRTRTHVGVFVCR